ncbi:MAG: insulinase family protein, partial [Oscillospiraceae bacterium]|nr:insulinase family protein [Oscillospiraceae bacterium]
TANCPDQEQLGALLDDLYGGVIEPTVLKLGEIQASGFVATFLDDQYAWDDAPISGRAAELLGDLLLRPATRNGRLRTDYVDSERDKLIAQIKSQRNDKESYAALRLSQEMCRGETYAVDRLGSLETARAIRVAKLDRYYKTLLKESRLELYYCGSQPVDQIRQAWVESLMGLPRRSHYDLPVTQFVSHPDEVGEVTEKLDVAQAKLALGLRTQTRLDSPDYPALLVTNALLGDAPGSKLFQNVREKRSLCYYVMSGLDKYKGLMMIYSGVSPEKAEEAKTEILAQIEAVKAGDFAPKELEAARRYAVNDLTTSLDSQGGLYRFYRAQALADPAMTAEELIAMVREVTAEDVKRAAGRLELDTVYLLTGSEGEEAAHGAT